MKRQYYNFAAAFLFVALLFGTTPAQDIPEEQETTPADSMVNWPDSAYFRANLPEVDLVTNSFYLQKDFYPDYYKSEYDVYRDLRKAANEDSSLVAMWDSLGTKILGIIETLSGVNWVERGLDVHLLRYLPVEFMYDPLILPIEGIKHQTYIEAAPTGLYRFFNLIRILSGRNLMQLYQVQYRNSGVGRHPLMEQSQYRFDILSLTLAAATAELVMPADSLDQILSSEEFKIHNPGWEIYRNHFRHSWKLSPETPMLFYITRESAFSPLIELTKAPRVRKVKPRDQNSQAQMKLSAGGGRLGFSVSKTSRGYLEVVDIDTLGLAYANGLMVGDQIKRVNGEYPHNARELMAKILDKIDTDGVYLQLIRDGEDIDLLMVPVQEIPEEQPLPTDSLLNIGPFQKN